MAVAAFNAKTTYDYISTVDFINERNIDPHLYEKYPGQGIMKIWDLMGKWQEETNPVMEWAEDDWIFQAVGANAGVAAPGAGVSAVVTLQPADHTGSGKLSYPRVNFVAVLKNKMQAHVTAKNTTVDGAHTITLTPFRATDNLGAITAGDKIIFIGSAYGAGTDQGTGLTPLNIKSSNVLQIIKEDYAFDSTQGATKSYFKNMPKWTYKGEKDTFKRFQTGTGLTLLIQERSDATYSVGGKIVRMTQGLFPFIRSGGNVFAASGFSGTTMDDIIKKMNKQKGSKSIQLFEGINFAIALDNTLTAAMKTDQINYTAFSGGDKGKEKAINLGFSAFRKADYQFFFKTIEEFSEPHLLGAPGFTYEDMAFGVPMDTRKITENGKSVDADSLSLRYLSGRKYEHWTTGGGTDVDKKTDGIDEVRMHYRCEVGLKAVSANRFFIVE